MRRAPAIFLHPCRSRTISPSVYPPRGIAERAQGDALDGSALNFLDWGDDRKTPVAWREPPPVSRHQGSSAPMSWANRSPASAGHGFSPSGQAAGGDQGACGVREDLARFELVGMASAAWKRCSVVNHRSS